MTPTFPRTVRVKSGRVHQVQRLWPGKFRTRVKFICGHSVTYGVLGQYEGWTKLYAPDAPVTCARCGWVAECRQRR